MKSNLWREITKFTSWCVVNSSILSLGNRRILRRSTSRPPCSPPAPPRKRRDSFKSTEQKVSKMLSFISDDQQESKTKKVPLDYIFQKFIYIFREEIWKGQGLIFLIIGKCNLICITIKTTVSGNRGIENNVINKHKSAKKNR